MSYFEDASLVLIPSAQKLSKIYSVKPTDGTGDLTFTRSNDTATRVGPDGLIEKVRTNLALQSQTFDNASWVKVSATITANATTAPDGTLTADKLIANSGYDPTSATGNLTQTNVVTSNIHTISLYAKAAEFTSIRFRENFSVGSFLTIDLTNGSITGAGSQYINPTATAVGDGWYRISFVTPATADLGKYSIRVANTGDGTSGVFIWGLQFEVSDFGATPYIATTTAAVSVGPVANVPRLDYLNSSCPRLLLEPQRTNLALWSENFDNAGWTKTNTTATANAATSPDGYTNAESILDNSTSGQHRVENAISSSIATGQTVAISFFAKKNTHDWCQVTSGGQTNDQWASFNLATGTIGNTSASANAKIEDYGNGWYRLSITATTTANNAILSSILSLTNNTNANTRSPSYVGTGGGVYIYGAQMEAGAYATSYIPTLGAAVTRAQDQAEKASISSLIGATEGTMFVDILFTGAADNNPAYIQTWASQAERLGLFYSSSSNLIRPFLVTSSGSADFSLGFTPTAGTRYKMAFCYKANDYAFFVNGAQVTIDARATVPTAGTKLFVGCLDSAAQANRQFSNINQALLFKTRLTNAQLAELTTI